MTPTFDIDLSIEGARLVDVNPWLNEFLKVDAEMGVFSMYSELAAAEGRFEGYVRPILEDPQFVSANEDEDGPFRKAWEGLVNLAAKILENKEEEQVATQIPLRGEITEPDVDVLTAMVNLCATRSSPRSRTRSKARSPARRRERRALPLRRAAGRGTAGPRAIAPGTPARSLLSPLVNRLRASRSRANRALTAAARS